MLTAANRTTKRAQELLATSGGELLTFPAGAAVQSLNDTGNIAGPIHFLGMIVLAGSDAAQATVTSDGSTVYAWKSAAGTAAGLILPFPIYCPNGITCTRNSGTSPTFLVYFIPA